MKQTRSLSKFSCLSKYTRLNPMEYTTFSYRVWRIKKSEVFLFYWFFGWMWSMAVVMMGVCGSHRCHRLKSTESIITLNRRQSKHSLADPDGGQWVRKPLKSHKSVGFPSNTGQDPLSHKATKLEFNVGPSSARQRNAIQKKQKQKTLS